MLNRTALLMACSAMLLAAPVFAKANDGGAITGDRSDLIKQAATLLNKDTKSDWAENGRPSLTAIRKHAKDATITQDELDAALPDFRKPEPEPDATVAVVKRKGDEKDDRPRLNQVRVVATERGYYGGMVREAGDSFVFTGIPGAWMRPETGEEKKARQADEREATEKARKPDTSGASLWAHEVAKPDPTT